MAKTIVISPIMLALYLSLTGTTCDKDGSSDSKSGLLTQNAWRYEKAGFDSNEDGNIDALDPRIAYCGKDDLVLFNSDGTGIFKQASANCNLTDPSTLPFTWSFQDNKKKIYFQDQNFVIQTLSDSLLEIYTFQQFAGITTKYIIVMKH